jgi:protein-tyrosine phosphatase
MIDIHCHILHSLDDGARNLEESLEMAGIAYADGTRHIIATPHFSEKFLTDRDLVLRRIEELQTELDRIGLDLTIHSGNEVRIDSPAFVREQMRAKRFHYLAQPQKFILIEQRWTDYEQATPQVMASILDSGIIPILPHPERHFFFRDNPELLLALIEGGVWTQVSVDSLNGTNGEEAKRFAEWMADHNYIHTLASDAHSVERKPNLSEGYAIIEGRIHKERAEEISSRARRILT